MAVAKGVEVSLPALASLQLAMRITNCGSVVRHAHARLTPIEDSKRAEASLRQKAESLRASNIELEQFNRANVGPELRTIHLKQESNERSRCRGEPPRDESDRLRTGRVPETGPPTADGGGA